MRHHHDLITRGSVRLAMLLIVAAVSTAFGQTGSTAAVASAAQRGKATYQQKCAVCHGERANGKTSHASALTPRPADLTIMWKHSGTSVAETVEAAIRGQDRIVAHDSPAMGAWYAVFLADANGSEAAANGRVEDLVKFIESVQTAPSKRHD